MWFQWRFNVFQWLFIGFSMSFCGMFAEDTLRDHFSNYMGQWISAVGEIWAGNCYLDSVALRRASSQTKYICPSANKSVRISSAIGNLQVSGFLWLSISMLEWCFPMNWYCIFVGIFWYCVCAYLEVMIGPITVTTAAEKWDTNGFERVLNHPVCLEPIPYAAVFSVSENWCKPPKMAVSILQEDILT